MDTGLQIKELSAADFDQRVREASLPVLVIFSADWSGPFHIMVPILNSLAAKYSDRMRFFRFDIEKYPETANEFGIRGVPAILMFRNGEAVDLASGIVSQHELESKIRTLTGGPGSAA